MNDSESAARPLPAVVATHADRALVGWTVAVCLGVPLIRPALVSLERWLRPARRFVDEPLRDQIQMLVIQGMVTLGAFVLGATVGSFLNVVVHRLPLGRSPLRGRSHCPTCGAAIRARDNVPIVGWLRLGGRCRDCGALIAARYPIVEAICGGLVLLLWEMELLSGGANIPVREPNMFSGLVWIVLYPRFDLIGLFLCHLAVLLTFLVWALVAADGGSVPWRHQATVIAVAALVPTVFPTLHPLPLAPGAAASPAWLHAGVAVAVVGIAVGGALGTIIERSLGGGTWATACLALWGAACGWQAALATATVFVGLEGINRLAARGTPWVPLPAPWLTCAAAVIQLVAWRAIHTLAWPV